MVIDPFDSDLGRKVDRGFRNRIPGNVTDRPAAEAQDGLHGLDGQFRRSESGSPRARHTLLLADSDDATGVTERGRGVSRRASNSDNDRHREG